MVTKIDYKSMDKLLIALSTTEKSLKYPVYLMMSGKNTIISAVSKREAVVDSVIVKDDLMLSVVLTSDVDTEDEAPVGMVKLGTAQDVANAFRALNHVSEDPDNAVVVVKTNNKTAEVSVTVNDEDHEIVYNDLKLGKDTIHYPNIDEMKSSDPDFSLSYTDNPEDMVRVEIVKGVSAFIRLTTPGSYKELEEVCKTITKKFTPKRKTKKGENFMGAAARRSQKNEDNTKTEEKETKESVTSDKVEVKETVKPKEEEEVKESKKDEPKVESKSSEKDSAEDTEEKDTPTETPKPKKKRRSPEEVLEEKIQKAVELLQENGYAVSKVPVGADSSAATPETIKQALTKIIDQLDNLAVDITPEQALNVIQNNITSTK